MKKLKKLLYIVPLLGLMATACTDIESIEIDHIGGNNTKDDVESEAYYADLRAYKETAKNYGRPVAFGWFSNWAPTGAMRRGYLTSVPDSMDIISMWSGAPGRYEITEAQKKDKEASGYWKSACFHTWAKGAPLLRYTMKWKKKP